MLKSFIIILSIIISHLSFCFNGSNTHYELKNEPIDIIMPCCKKDLVTLELAIAGIKKYGQNIRRIIVISAEKLTDNAEWFNEADYPFGKYDIAYEIFRDVQKTQTYLNQPKNRTGWLFQQLLKLYAPFVIPDISSNVMALDSDTIFLNPISFLNDKNASCFNTSTEYNKPYFEHAARLIPGFRKIYKDYSGICHWMVFQRSILEDMMDIVEEHHKVPFWKAFCHCIDQKYLNASSASEYELYFNFALSKTKQVEIRNLTWKNLPYVGGFEQFKRQNYHYVSCHEWMRG